MYVVSYEVWKMIVFRRSYTQILIHNLQGNYLICTERVLLSRESALSLHAPQIEKEWVRVASLENFQPTSRTVVGVFLFTKFSMHYNSWAANAQSFIFQEMWLQISQNSYNTLLWASSACLRAPSSADKELLEPVELKHVPLLWIVKISKRAIALLESLLIWVFYYVRQAKHYQKINDENTYNYIFIS